MYACTHTWNGRRFVCRYAAWGAGIPMYQQLIHTRRGRRRAPARGRSPPAPPTESLQSFFTPGGLADPNHPLAGGKIAHLVDAIFASEQLVPQAASFLRNWDWFYRERCVYSSAHSTHEAPSTS